MQNVKPNPRKYELSAAEWDTYLNPRRRIARQWRIAHHLLQDLEYEEFLVCEVVPTPRFIWIRLAIGLAIYVYRRPDHEIRQVSPGSFSHHDLEALEWLLPRNTRYVGELCF